MPSPFFLVFIALLVLFPLLEPWKRPFGVAWLVIWFGLWLCLFARLEYETGRLATGNVSIELGLGILLLTASSLIRLVLRGLLYLCCSKKTAIPQ